MAAAVHDGTPKESQRHHVALNPFRNTVTVATTQIDEVGDDVLLYGPFPAGSYFLVPSLLVTASAIDSHGTPTAVVDFGIGDSDGVIDTVLINDSDIGQSGGTDYPDAATAFGLVDVGGKYLICTVVTAPATAAAGTILATGAWFPVVTDEATTAVS
jgi:hypothetical protein